MNLKYLSLDAYKKLQSDIENNKDKYYSEGTEWLADYFAENGIEDYYKESSIVVNNFTLVKLPDSSDESKNKCDLTNVQALYSAFKDRLTPMQASDPMLWTALCHFDFKDYIIDRWKNENSGEVRLDKRFFAQSGRTSLLYYNAISRLWWSGYLTYEEDSKSFSLTETLLSAQQIQKDLFDQRFSMNRDIVRGLLSALRKMQDLRGDRCTTIFRKCCDSYLNHYGAVSVLDFLSSEEIEQIAFNFMRKFN